MKHNMNILYLIIKIVFGVICIWSYFSICYDYTIIDPRTISKSIFGFYIAVKIIGSLAVFIVIRIAFKTRGKCVYLAREIENQVNGEKRIQLLEYLSNSEKEYFKACLNRVTLATFINQTKLCFYWMLIIFCIGIIHILYLCISANCTLFRTSYLLIILTSYTFAYYVWNYAIFHWEFSARILNKIQTNK